MNELENTLQKILEKSIELAEQTGEFVIDQAPKLLQQFYLWHTVGHILGMLFAILIFFIFTKVIRLWGEKKSTDPDYDRKIFGLYYDDEGGAIAVYVIMVVVAIISTSIFCVDLYKLIFIIIAPKLYLLEYFL